MASRRLLKYVGLSSLLHLLLAALVVLLLVLGKWATRERGLPAAPEDGGVPEEQEREEPAPPVAMPDRPGDVDLFQRNE